jgi:competence protein ComEC
MPVAVLFILGISAHHVLPCWPLAWLISLAVLLGISLVVAGRAAMCCAAIALATLLAGLIAGELADYYYPRDHIGAFAGDEPRLAWVEGRINESPRLIEAPPRGRPLPEKQLVTIKVRAVRTWNGWIGAEGEMPVTISPPVIGLSTGQTVRMLGRIERPAPAMNPGGFDAAGHYRRQRVLASMHVSRPFDVQIVSADRPIFSPLAHLREFSRRMLAEGFDPPHTADRALLRAMIFGDREPAVFETADDFTKTGTTHLMAANGARIAILAALVYLLCRLLRLSPRPTLAIVTGSVAIFGFVTLPAAEAMRPVIVCAAVGAGLIGRRTVDSIQLLALAALAVLILRPLDLYGAGFQLSFTIVLGLILFTRPLLKFLERFENVDRRVAKSFTTPTDWQRRRDHARRRVIELAAAGTVAWVVAVPLVAFHFQQFNPWTIPFGLVLSPLAFAALPAGFMKIGLTMLCPPLAGAWALLASLPAGALRYGVHLLAQIPGSDLPISPPPVWQMLLYYGLLCLPLAPWPKQRVRWCARCAPAGACVLLFLLPLLAGSGPRAVAAGGVRITLLSVGAGQCAVIEPSDGEAILLDAGSSSSADPARTSIEPFLRYERCRSIGAIWLSHGDYDHISAVRQLVPDYGVSQVLTSPHFRRHAPESKPCESLLQLLDSTQHSPRLVVAGNRMTVGSDATIEVLWPPADCTFNSNNAGLVLKLTCRGRSILFPGDIQEPAERELLKHPEKLRCDVLIAPHHGSSELATPDFLRAVNARVILASNDGRLTMKQRLFDVEAQGRPLYRTSGYGAMTVEIGGNGTITLIPFLHRSPVIVEGPRQ